MKSQIKAILGSVAPSLATALGGPLGGMAAKFALGQLGLSTEATDPVQALEKVVLDASPETISKLKEADYAFQVRMRELGIREEELGVQDRDSARKMAQASGLKPQATLSALYTIGYFAMLGLAMSGVMIIPPTMGTEFTAAMSFLTSIQLQVMNFWFGSSSGSKEKTKALEGR